MVDAATAKFSPASNMVNSIMFPASDIKVVESDHMVDSAGVMLIPASDIKEVESDHTNATKVWRIDTVGKILTGDGSWKVSSGTMAMAKAQRPSDDSS